MDYSKAKNVMDNGLAVRNMEWENRDQFVFLIKGFQGNADERHDLGRCAAVLGVKNIKIDPYFMKYTSKGSFVPWTPTSSDLLSTTWDMVTPIQMRGITRSYNPASRDPWILAGTPIISSLNPAASFSSAASTSQNVYSSSLPNGAKITIGMINDAESDRMVKEQMKELFRKIEEDEEKEGEAGEKELSDNEEDSEKTECNCSENKNNCCSGMPEGLGALIGFTLLSSILNEINNAGRN